MYVGAICGHFNSNNPGVPVYYRYFLDNLKLRAGSLPLGSHRLDLRVSDRSFIGVGGSGRKRCRHCTSQIMHVERRMMKRDNSRLF